MFGLGCEQLSTTKCQDSPLQRRNTGKSQGCSRSIEPTILPNEGSDTYAATICLSRCPGKCWHRLDEYTEGKRHSANGDSGSYHVRRSVDYRHVVGTQVRDIYLAAVRGHRQTECAGSDGDRNATAPGVAVSITHTEPNPAT